MSLINVIFKNKLIGTYVPIPRICVFVIWLCCLYFFFVIQFECIHASCSIEAIKSTTQQYGYYRTRYGTEYGSFYPTLYFNVECLHINTNNQNLNDILNPVNSNKSYYQDEYEPKKIIKFADSHVRVIQVGSFKSISNVTEIYLNASYVNDIQPGGFNNLEKLVKLHLDHNNISQITKRVFNHLTALEEIDLGYNNIQTIEKNSFLGLTKLQIVLLHHNGLTEIDYFPRLESFVIINLSYNKLTNVSGILYKRDLKLTSGLAIDLSYNFLSSVNLSDFPSRTSELNLENNDIEYMVAISMPSLARLLLNSNKLLKPPLIIAPLTYLNLSRNSIEELDTGIFTTNETKILDLSVNSIKNLNTDVFDNLTALVTLDLQENHLDFLPIGLFQPLLSLKYLNISGNKLSEFEFGTFSGLHNLKSLDISNNSLTYLTESMFHPLVELSELHIGNNLITAIDPGEFLLHLKALSKVYLNNNPWICKSLSNIVTQFEQRNIIVEKGVQRKTTNLNGIACYDYKSFKKQLEDTTSANNNWNQFNNFFNEGFFNTSFYNFFKNNTNLQFESKLTDVFEKGIDETLEFTLRQILNSFRELKESIKHEDFFSDPKSHSEKLSGNFEERVINQISNLLVLFMVTILILLCILGTVVMKNFREHLKCFRKPTAVCSTAESIRSFELL